MLTISVVKEAPIIGRALAGLVPERPVAVTIRGIDKCNYCRWEPLPVKVVQGF